MKYQNKIIVFKREILSPKYVFGIVKDNFFYRVSEKTINNPKEFPKKELSKNYGNTTYEEELDRKIENKEALVIGEITKENKMIFYFDHRFLQPIAYECGDPPIPVRYNIIIIKKENGNQTRV
jgi:hypothetical protein